MKKQKGMTIIEMMVVFVIIAILLSMVFINYRQIQRRTVLDSAAYKLASDIRSQESNAGLNDNNCSGVPGYKYGYGLHFSTKTSTSKKSYFLFPDCDGDGSYQAGSGREIFFSSDVELESVTNENLTGFDIVFNPPGPLIVMTSSPEEVWITIHLISDPSAKKVIKVNKVGMIDIDN